MKESVTSCHAVTRKNNSGITGDPIIPKRNLDHISKMVERT